MKKNISIQNIILAVFLLVAIILLFFWFSTQTSIRTEEQNKNYAADSARLKSEQIDDELDNALSQIESFAYFVGEGLTEPDVTVQTLAKLEETSYFDAVLFTDSNGVDHASDGRTDDVTERRFFLDGIQGKSSIEIIFDPRLFDETMACFYAPVQFEGQTIGVLRGVFLAEEYLQNMLATTYFGEEAQVFLCVPDGRVIASSDNLIYEGHILDVLTENGMIDQNTASQARPIFEVGGSDTFICDSSSKTDNICVAYLPHNQYVLVQTFPKNVTQNMILDGTMAGIQLEIMLVLLFAVYIVVIMIRAQRRRKALEQENREMGYIINGVNTLFTRFVLVDFEHNYYHYLAGT